MTDQAERRHPKSAGDDDLVSASLTRTTDETQ